MASPLVSVVMPVYNAEPYVAQAVESILTQTFKDFEFLIFDDGSTDRSLEIIQAYASQDDRIRVFAKPHRGYVPWLNEGIELAGGEFIARMDADDVSLPRRFTRQVEYMNQHPACVALGCNMMMIDSDGEPLGAITYETDDEAVQACLLRTGLNAMSHSACMVRRSALLAIHGYREEYESIEDFDLWLRLAERGSLANIPEIMFLYRQHHWSVNATQSERQKLLADEIITEARRRRGLKPLDRSIWDMGSSTFHKRHQTWAWYAACSGHRKTAIKHLSIAISAQPFNLRTWAVLILCCLPNGIISLLKRLRRSRIWSGWYGVRLFHQKQFSGRLI